MPDPQAVDALNIPCKNLVAYAFPPSALLAKVVQKLSSVQDNPNHPRLGVKTVVLGPNGDVWTYPDNYHPFCTLLKQPLKNHYHANPTSLNLHAWYLGVQLSKNMGSVQRWQKELLLL